MQTINEPQDESMTIDTAQSKADAVRVAFREVGTSQTATILAAWLAERGGQSIRRMSGSSGQRYPQEAQRPT